jgi:hypothetical protein
MSMINAIERACCDHFSEKENHQFDFYNFWVSTPILKFEMTIFVDWDCELVDPTVIDVCEIGRAPLRAT